MTVQTKPAIVTTGSVAGSRKIYRKFYSSPPDRPDIVGPFRTVDLHPSSRHASFRLYDPSGPFTDSGFMLDLDGGLPQLRGSKFAQRGFETMDARAVKPEDNDFAAADKLVPPCPATRTRLTRHDGPPVRSTSMPAPGSPPEEIFVAHRKNLGRIQVAKGAAERRADGAWGAGMEQKSTEFRAGGCRIYVAGQAVE